MKKYGELGEELLLPQERSRKQPKLGELFQLKLSTGNYLLGRVINTDARIGFEEESYLLIYLYSHLFSEIDSEQLDKFDFEAKNLLVPPFFSLKKFWTIGYALTIANREIIESEVYPVHYFYDMLYKKYYDENGNLLEPPTESDTFPIGVCGFGNLTTLDLDIRKVLKLDIPDWGKSYHAS